MSAITVGRGLCAACPVQEGRCDCGLIWYRDGSGKRRAHVTDEYLSRVKANR